MLQYNMRKFPAQRLLVDRCIRKPAWKAGNGFQFVRKERNKLTLLACLWNWWLESNRVREGDSRREPGNVAFNVMMMQVDDWLKS
jgi:hypothetical protein